MKITINGNEFTLKFGYGCLRQLSQKWEVATLQDVLNRFQTLMPAKGDEIMVSFELIDSFIDLVSAAVYAAPGDQYMNFDEGDCGDFLFANTEKVQEIVNAFMASMPQAKPDDTVGKRETAMASPPPETR